jgi:hypothetical protein
VAVGREIPLPRAIDRHLARQLFAEIAAHPGHQPAALGWLSSAISARNGSAIPSFALAATRAEDRELGGELSPAFALRSSATKRGTCTCVFANRENVGPVDHPEHHAQARPKVERRL